MSRKNRKPTTSQATSNPNSQINQAFAQDQNQRPEQTKSQPQAQAQTTDVLATDSRVDSALHADAPAVANNAANSDLASASITTTLDATSAPVATPEDNALAVASSENNSVASTTHPKVNSAASNAQTASTLELASQAEPDLDPEAARLARIEEAKAKARARAAERAKEREQAVRAKMIDPTQLDAPAQLADPVSTSEIKSPSSSSNQSKLAAAKPQDATAANAQMATRNSKQAQPAQHSQMEQAPTQAKSLDQKVADAASASNSSDGAADKQDPSNPKSQSSNETLTPEEQAELKKRNVHAFFAGLTLAVFAALCVLCIMVIGHHTEGKIQAYRDSQEQRLLATMLPEAAAQAQGKLKFKCKLLSDPRIGKKMQTYIVQDETGKTLGLIANYSTSRGYSNPLILIAGVDLNGHVSRIEVKLSRETPGIGDKVEHRKGNYLDQFVGLGLDNANWEVKKFGGQFDYITGATVTSRAVVLATKDLLQVLKETAHPDLLPDCR